MRLAAAIYWYQKREISQEKAAKSTSVSLGLTSTYQGFAF
jgi:hypothetical protein